MRVAICAMAIIALVPLSLAAENGSELKLGVHVRDFVAAYSPRYEGSEWQSGFGSALKTAVESQLRSGFPGTITLSSFPPAKESESADAYVVVEQAIARFYGKGAVTAEAQTTVSVFDANRAPVKDIEVSTEYKVPYTKDNQQARFEQAVMEVAGELASKVMAGLTDPELQARLQRTAAVVRQQRERPTAKAVPVAASNVFGRLVLTTTPPGMKVFLDDVYWGVSDAEGKLTIAGVAGGQHVVRLNGAGYKELKQTVTVVAGDNPVALKAEVAPPKPLKEAEIEQALRYDVPKPRIDALIKEFGVDFTLTKAAELRLLDAGADKEMLTLIGNSKKEASAQ